MEDYLKPWTPPSPAPGLRQGTLLREAFRLLAGRLPALLLFSLVDLAFASLARALSGAAGPVPSFALNLLSALAALAASAAAAAAALPGAGGRPAGAAECLAKAFRRLPALAALSVPFFLCRLALLVALAVGAALSAGASRPAWSLLLPATAVAAAGLLAGIFCLAAPSCALEGANPAAALRRSLALTRGCRLAAFPAFLAVFALGALAALASAGAEPGPGNSALSSAAFLALNLAALSVTGALYRLRLDAFRAAGRRGPAQGGARGGPSGPQRTGSRPSPARRKR
jgi:hypothetical protein